MREETAMSTVTFDFSGKVVLVTGGGSGIGRQVAKDFVRAGARVVIAGRTRSRLDAAVAELGDGVTAATLDVGDGAAVSGLISEIVDQHGRLDVVVSNAA